MKILICGINYAPELTGIGKYTGEMAAYLAARGHDVRVVTAPPYYPHWLVQGGYKWWRYLCEHREGVAVYRCPLWVPRSPSGPKRLVHLGSFALSSIPALLLQVPWRPDAVLSVAPALANAPFVLLLARLTGARAWLHIQDFELDAAINLGILPAGGIFTGVFSRVERWLLWRFDVVSTISQRMLERLLEKGVSPRQAHLFTNWVDTKRIYPIFDSENEFRQRLVIPGDKVVALYSGNMGRKQGLEHVITSARQLQGHDGIHFVLCGEGAVKDELLAQARDLTNVQFLPLQPVERLNQLLNMADIHLLPQRADAADLVMPSKLTGMLASGRPVVATAMPGTEIARVVGEVGVLAHPGDPAALSGAIHALARDPEKRAELGIRGRKYVEDHWTFERVMGGFESQLGEIV
jgi:colanic acid biosynthesis glycosyl transferase WcaI